MSRDMLYAVLEMPYSLAMDSTLSRAQYHSRGRQAAALLREQEAAMQMALESLEELVANQEIDFGPAYGLTKERQKKAITKLKRLLK